MIDKIITILATFIIGSIGALGYGGIVLMMGIESACIPLPSEIIMPFSGFLVFQGRFTLLGVTLAGSAGCLLGSIIAYLVGIYGGRIFIEKYGRYFLISKHDLEMADNFFNKYGASAIFFSRLLPVIRTFISLPAGIARMNFNKFAVYTFLGSIPWCFALAYIGKKLGDHWDILGQYFHKFDAAIIVLFIAGIIWFIINRFNNLNNK